KLHAQIGASAKVIERSCCQQTETVCFLAGRSGKKFQERPGPWCPTDGSLRGEFSRASKRLLELRQYSEEVADEAVVCDLEDGGLLVLVDGDDDLRILHAG